MTLEEVWRQREEDVYPALFGPMSRGIFPMNAKLFQEQFGRTQIDPTWLMMGVFEYAPTPDRASWLYVTSGYSNPWKQKPSRYEADGVSGSGLEYVLATTEQAEWPIIRLQTALALTLLVSAGHYPDKKTLGMHDYIPLGFGLNGDPDCVLRSLLVAPAEQVPDGFSLSSGKVRLAGLTAVSDAELAYGRTAGAEALIDRLRAAGHHPVNDPRRASIV